MDALLVGALAALGTVVGMLYWVLLVRPHNLLGLFSAPRPDDASAWEEDEDATYDALRTIGALLVLVVGFFTGLAVSFLAATS